MTAWQSALRSCAARFEPCSAKPRRATREDEEFGDRRGDELPPELASKEARLAAILAAKEALEAEAKEKAASEANQKALTKGASATDAERAAKTG